jgi:hypothetical protein
MLFPLAEMDSAPKRTKSISRKGQVPGTLEPQGPGSHRNGGWGGIGMGNDLITTGNWEWIYITMGGNTPPYRESMSDSLKKPPGKDEQMSVQWTHLLTEHAPLTAYHGPGSQNG